DLHARDQLLLLLVEAVDLLDLLVELADLGAQAVVAVALRVDHLVHHEPRHAGHGRGADQRREHADAERLLALDALLFAPGEEVYARHVSRSSAEPDRTRSEVKWRRAARPGRAR